MVRPSLVFCTVAHHNQIHVRICSVTRSELSIIVYIRYMVVNDIRSMLIISLYHHAITLDFDNFKDNCEETE